MTNVPSADKLIGAYVLLRDQKKQLTDRHKQELEPYNSKLRLIEAGLMGLIQSAGANSIKTKLGTAYTKERNSVTIQDWDTTLQFILDQGLTHMLEHRLAKSAVEEYITANGEVLPGVGISSELVVNIRRS